jgi:hypothetical protein
MGFGWDKMGCMGAGGCLLVRFCRLSRSRFATWSGTVFQNAINRLNAKMFRSTLQMCSGISFQNFLRRDDVQRSIIATEI